MSYTLLIAEDSNTVRTAIRLSLSGKGYNYLDCASGDQALAISAKCRLDLIICDAQIRGLDSIELCERIKSSDQFATVPFIMLAGPSFNRHAEAASRGVDEIVAKPFSAEHLLQTVTQALTRRAEQEWPLPLSASVEPEPAQAPAAAQPKGQGLVYHGIFDPITGLPADENMMPRGLDGATASLDAITPPPELLSGTEGPSAAELNELTSAVQDRVSQIVSQWLEKYAEKELHKVIVTSAREHIDQRIESFLPKLIDSVVREQLLALKKPR